MLVIPMHLLLLLPACLLARLLLLLPACLLARLLLLLPLQLLAVLQAGGATSTWVTSLPLQLLALAMLVA